MRFAYKFSNLLGTVYKRGDIIFSKDGNTVICPVGNKISLSDLRNNRSYTLPVEARYDYSALALSPNGLILIAAEYGGEVHIINLNFRIVLYRKFFSSPIMCIKFSPDGKHFAMTKDNKVFVYTAPGADKRVYDPFILKDVFDGAFDDTTCLDWSHDSRLVAAGSRDMTTRVYGFAKMLHRHIYTIGGNKDTMVGVFFEEKSYNICTVSKNGHVNLWDCKEDADRLKLEENQTKTLKNKIENEEEEDDIPVTQEELENEAKKVTKKELKPKMFYTRRVRLFLDELLDCGRVTVSSAQYHAHTHMLVVACITGDFVLLDMNDNGALVHSLNISKQRITSVAMNPSGDWIALGVSSLGQLVVWEWQSESFILKQQGHFNNMRIVIYSPDGQNLATGGEDGKVKMWSSQSSFCYVTFSEHTAAVTGLAFTQSGRAILSSSLDGTVRAFDLTRYRNFKTLTSPRPTQFSCLSVDCSGELVAAGGQDAHNIYLWSLQTGRLLEVLGGHEGPVVSLQFSLQPGSTLLASTSWDGSLKVWDAIAETTAKESVRLSADGLCLCIRPDGKQIAVATIDGQISMFNPSTGQQEGNIMGQTDLGAGRADADMISAKTNMKSKAFTSICYSSDGSYLLAGGQSKNVCIYSIADEILIKKFEITQNRSFDAMDETVSRRMLAENGVNLALIEGRDDDDGGTGMRTIKLPGTKTGDKSQRAFRPEVRVSSLTFSPTGSSWAASTSEGLLVYSVDTTWLFDPLDLDTSNTPSAVKQKLREEEYSVALMMAVRINIDSLKQEVLETIPLGSVSVIVNNLPLLYVEGVLSYLSKALESSSHLGLYAHWAAALVSSHGRILKTRASQITNTLNAIQKALTTHHTNLSKVCSGNEYMLSYLLSQTSLRKKRKLTVSPGSKEDPDVATEGSTDEEMDEEHQVEELFSDVGEP